MSRLIDADALFQMMEKTAWYNNADRDEIAEKLILNAPTIEPDLQPDGTLVVDCANYDNVKRVLVQHGTNGTLFYADAERKKGRWEIYVISMLDGEGCRCSECSAEGVPYWDFCPNCGADMRGNEDD